MSLFSYFVALVTKSSYCVADIKIRIDILSMEIEGGMLRQCDLNTLVWEPGCIR